MKIFVSQQRSIPGTSRVSVSVGAAREKPAAATTPSPFLRGMIDAATAYRQAKAAEALFAELSRLPDSELRHLGIARTDIASEVRRRIYGGE